MGKKKDNKKEQKKKDNKKKLKNIDKYVPEEGNEVQRLIKIGGGVLAVLIVFYIGFAIYHGDLFKKVEKEKEAIQDVEIMAGTSLTMEESDYYVLYYDFNGDNKSYAEAFYNVYDNKQEKSKMYKVNLGSGLNKAYVAANANEVNTSSSTSLKVIDVTLIRVQNGKPTEVYAGLEKVKSIEEKILK